MPVPPALLSLSDSQITAVMAAAKVLAPPDRSAFLELLAQELATQRVNGAELGDGAVYRVVRELQRRFWDPPHPGTYGGWVRINAGSKQ
jgi:hypothetical protein